MCAFSVLHYVSGMQFIFLLKEKQLSYVAILNAGEFDYIVCSHNLEHCNDWRSVVKAMCSVIKVGGEIYIATPSIKTLSFPSRNGTLNFKDDSTHNEIVDFNELEIIIKSNGLEIKYMSISDKPFFMYLVGLINELPSKIKNQVLRGTWAYWGFEAKMWARKFGQANTFFLKPQYGISKNLPPPD